MSRLPAVGILRTVSLAAAATLAALAPTSIQAMDRPPGSAPQEVVVDTVGGRPVVTSPFPQQGADAGEWRLVEELRLGNVVGDGPEGFGKVNDVAVDGAGRIFVLDVGSKEVRVFGRDGTYVRRMVREGRRPGEIRWSGLIQRITWRAPDQLWISGGQQRMVVDTLGSQLRRTAGRRYAGMFFPGEVPWSSSVIAAGRDGSIFSVVDLTMTRGPDDLGVNRTYLVRSPVSVDHEILPGDTLAITTRSIVEIGAGEGSIATRGGGAVSVQRTRGEDPRHVWTVAPDGTVWLAHRSRYRFDRLTFVGDTILTVQLGDVPPLPTDESEFVPVLAALASSPEGWLWVQREEPETEGPSTWDVLDNCGRHRGTVTASVGLTRAQVGPGGELYGLSSDELGLDFVHRFRLRSLVGTPVVREVCSF